MAQPNFEHQLKIAHVLFIDIVGYSKLLINEQSDVLRELNQIVREAEQFRAAEAEGKLIRLPTGDGMALAFFTGPDAPVRCALEISKRLRNHPLLALRMGINSGPVDEVLDVNERSNIAGTGITIAQRVMDCGDAGHILLSKRIADDLAQYSHWREQLHDLGRCEVKHSVKIDIVNLYAADVGNPAIPEKLQKEKQIATATSSPPRRLHYSALIAAVLFVAFGFWFFSHPGAPKSTTTPTKKDADVAEKGTAFLLTKPLILESLETKREEVQRPVKSAVRVSPPDDHVYDFSEIEKQKGILKNKVVRLRVDGWVVDYTELGNDTYRLMLRDKESGGNFRYVDFSAEGLKKSGLLKDAPKGMRRVDTLDQLRGAARGVVVFYVEVRPAKALGQVDLVAVGNQASNSNGEVNYTW